MSTKELYNFKSIYHEIVIVSIIAMAQLLCQGSITMSMSTMDNVLSSFDPDATYPSTVKVWFLSSYALTLGTFIIISGKLGDIFGMTLMFNIGWLWCTITSLMTGLSIFSTSVVFYIICRALQGIGFAIIMPCGMGILGNLYPNGFRKHLMFSIIGAAGPTGATIGAIFAAIIAQLSWWPWCFFVLAIVCCITGIFSLIFVPKNVNIASFKDFKKFDYLGSLLGVTSLILLNFSLTQGPLVGWQTSYIIVLLVISVVLIVCFFIYEVRFCQTPLLPSSVLNIKIGLVLLIIALGWGSFGIWQYYYWVIILELRHYTPIMASLTYIPLLIFGIIAAMLVAFIIHKMKASYILLAAAVAFNGGCIMLSIMPVDQSFWRISFGQMFILTWGMDMSFAAGSIILSDYLPKKYQGIAGSLILTVVNYSVSLFLSIGSNIEVETSKRGATSLQSYRNSIYFGIGISGLGVLMALTLVILQYYTHDSKGTFEEDESIESK